ncbi:MAG: hypothetical protein HY315_07740 [Acidobacteria bacterium]|nr:hypothetical protein [Acidobacteriota bacterium]
MSREGLPQGGGRWVGAFVAALFFCAARTSVAQERLMIQGSDLQRPGSSPASNTPSTGRNSPPLAVPVLKLAGFQSKLDLQPGPEEGSRVTGLSPEWLKAFGLASLQTLKNTRAQVEAHALEMIDPPGAYGLFTLTPVPGSVPASIGNGARSSGNTLTFWKGNYFFLVRGPAALERWAQDLAGQVGYDGVLPVVVEMLPRQGLNPDTVQFFVKELIPDDGRLGEIRPLLSLDKSVQAAIGRYPSGDQRVIVLGYPTQALALQSFQQVEAYVRDKNHGMYAKRAGAVLALTEGIPKERAVALLEAIRYTPSVKWIIDKKTPRARGGGVRLLLNSVVGSLVLSFVFVIGTGLIGAAFGVFRCWLRRFRPDNFLDRPERVEMIRLKLVDK